MSTGNHKNDELNDVDIAALFDADEQSSQIQQPSAELDALILNNAHTSQQTDVSIPGEETRRQKYAPVIATAAVILIGIGLTPLNDSTPNLASDQVSATKSMASSSDEEIAGISVSNTDAQAIDVSSDSDATGIELEEQSVRLEADSVDNTLAAEPNVPEDTLTTRENLSNKERSSQRRSDTAANAELAREEIPVIEAELTPVTTVDAEPESVTTVEATPEPESLPTVDATPAPKPPTVVEAAPEPEPVSTVEATLEPQPATIVEATPEPDPVTALKAAPEPNTAPAPAPEAEAAPQAESVTLASDSISSNLESAAAITQSLAPQSRLPEEPAENDVQSTRVSPDNYRNSPLLWVIEIKHLFNENKMESARSELSAFRQKHPNNVNERLLPPTLRTLDPDQ